MGKQFTAVLAVGLLGVEVVAGEVHEDGQYRLPDHTYTDILVCDAGYSRIISVDSSAAVGAPTGTIDLLKSLGVLNSVSITASHVQFTPVPFREDTCERFRGENCEPVEPAHPPEGSGDMFTGMSSLGVT
jgi:hypothetical protein